MTTKKRVKLSWAIIAASLNFAFIDPALAQNEPKCTGMTQCLEYIYLVDLEILKSVNTLPELVKSWIAPDDTKESYSGTLAENFVEYINLTIANDAKQISDQKDYFMKDYFSNASKPIPYVNQLTFTTLLTKEPFSGQQEKDAEGNKVNSAYNYIKNASGMNITHEVPVDSWIGSEKSKKEIFRYLVESSSL